MRTTYAHKQESIYYLANKWLVHKEKCVLAWANRYLHFGSKNTSGVEVANSVLKRYLDSSVSHLAVVLESAKLAIAMRSHYSTNGKQTFINGTCE